MMNLNFKFRLLLFIFPFVSISCREYTKNIELKSDSFFTVEFAEIVKNQREIKLSEVATDVKIVQFENIPEAMLGDVEDIELTNDYIFAKFWQHPILQFSREGKFIRNIGSKGKGPGEYSTCIKMSIDEESEQVFVYTGEYSIMVFDFEGEYRKTLSFQALTDFMNFWICGRDSTVVSYFEPFMGNEPFVFIEYNTQGDTLQTIANHVFWNTNGEFGSISPFFGEQNFSYRFEGKLHLKGAYNDTVYTYNPNNQFVPKFFIDLGKHKLPDDLIYERKRTRTVPDGLIWAGVHETSGYIFIPYGYHYDVDKPELRNENEGCALYNKKTKEGIAINESKQGGITDDMAGGPDFRLIRTNNDEAVMLVTAMEMKQHLDSEQFKNKEVTLKAEKEKLILLKNTLKEDDNHFLVMVELKENN